MISVYYVGGTFVTMEEHAGRKALQSLANVYMITPANTVKVRHIPYLFSQPTTVKKLLHRDIYMCVYEN